MALDIKKYLAILTMVAISFLVGSLPLMLSVLAIGVMFTVVCEVTGARLTGSEFLLVLLNVLLGNIFLFIYNKYQNFIPYWDYAGYYLECLNASKTMYSEGIVTFIKELYMTMCQNDYTKLPVLFTAPLMKLFGGSYAVYITINYNLFLSFFYFALALTIKRINKLFLPLMFLFVPFTNPIVRGYIDCIGLVFVAIWLCVVFDDKFEKIDVKRDVLLAILSVVLLFTRRWYLFFIASLALSLLLVGIVRKITEKEYKLKNLIINGVIIAGTMLLILIIFFFPYVQRTVTNRFSDTYSAYQFGSFIWNVKYYIRYYGVILTAFTAFGALAGIRTKRYRWFSLFLTVQIAITFIMFTRIQTISYHHQYLFASEMFLLILIGVSALKKAKKLLPCALIIILTVTFIYTYVPFVGGHYLEQIGFCAQKFTFPPKTNNVAGARKVADTLESLTTANGGYCYVLASSEKINDELIKNAYLPDKASAVTNWFGTAHVDKRDAFPNSLLVAKYIAVADPVQVHLNGEGQHIIEYFVNEILSGNVENLEKIETIDFSDGIKVHIYERKSGFSKEWLDKTKNYFMSLYPGHPITYDIDYIYSQN